MENQAGYDEEPAPAPGTHNTREATGVQHAPAAPTLRFANRVLSGARASVGVRGRDKRRRPLVTTDRTSILQRSSDPCGSSGPLSNVAQWTHNMAHSKQPVQCVPAPYVSDRTQRIPRQDNAVQHRTDQLRQQVLIVRQERHIELVEQWHIS